MYIPVENNNASQTILGEIGAHMTLLGNLTQQVAETPLKLVTRAELLRCRFTSQGLNLLERLKFLEPAATDGTREKYELRQALWVLTGVPALATAKSIRIVRRRQRVYTIAREVVTRFSEGATHATKENTSELSTQNVEAPPTTTNPSTITIQWPDREFTLGDVCHQTNLSAEVVAQKALEAVKKGELLTTRSIQGVSGRVIYAYRKRTLENGLSQAA